VSWGQPYQVLRPSGPLAALDRRRASRPSVVEDAAGTLRMWYAAHDGTTARILEAGQRRGRSWERRSVGVEPGPLGATDAAGVDAPSVVCTDAGFVMAHAGTDGGGRTRLHLAASPDGHAWSRGTLFPYETAEAVGATDPCLVVTDERWWLFHGEEDVHDGEPTRILLVTSADGVAWEPVGPVLGPGAGERGVGEPWVIRTGSGFTMVFVAEAETGSTVELATSGDGLAWERSGGALDHARSNHAGRPVRGPSLLRLRNGHLRLWYSAAGDDEPADRGRLWSTDLHGTEMRGLAAPPPAG